MTKLARYLGCGVICLLAAGLVACGGGGGGSSSGSSSGGASASTEPPPLPAPLYSGLAIPAALSPFLAGQVTHFVFADVDFALSFSQNLINPFLTTPQTINQTQTGPLGGQVNLNGQVTSSTDAWVTETFSGYSYKPQGASSSITLNGTLLIKASGTTISYGYTNYAITGTQVNIVLSGNASQENLPGDPATNQMPSTTDTLNLGVEDNIQGIDEEFVNFSVQSTPEGTIAAGSFTPNIDRTFSGRVYDSSVGYVDISTQGTEIYSSDPTQTTPVYGANISVAGSSNTSPLVVGPLNTYFFSVGISTNNDDVFNASARYNWGGFTADTTPAPSGSGPVAVAEEATTPALGVPITLDGRFSHSPSGDYLRMQWSLLYSPPGSHPILANVDLPQATLTADKAGDYLILLTVSDGSQTAQDTVTVSIPTNDLATTSTPMFQSVAGADVIGTIGAPVLLDGRASFNFSNPAASPTYSWQLIAPTGSNATLSSPNSAQPSFTPDVPGYYRVLLNPSDVNLDGTPAIQPFTVTVGEPIAFRSPVAFDGSLPTCNICQLFSVADLNGDGRPDMVINALTGNVYVYMNSGNGVFAPPTEIEFPVVHQESLFITIADLNGDGRPDIVASGVDTSNRTAVFVSLQNADGSFSAPQEYPYSALAPIAGEIAVGHLFGSSTLSVITIDGSGNLYDFPVNSNGTLGAPTTTAYPTIFGGYNMLDITDFNNDGISDLVMTEGGQTFGAAGVFEGTASGSFTTVANEGFDAAGVADLFGDSHNELVTAGPTSLEVYSESGTNPVSYPLPFDNPSLFIVPTAISFADLNGDGLTDIVILQNGGGGNGGPQFFYQSSNHTFTDGGIWILGGMVGQINGPLWVGDLNGDGIPDLVYESNLQTVVQFGYKP